MPNYHVPQLLRRWPRHRGEGSRGQALAELALVTPILLLLFAAAADLGRAYYGFVAIENASKEGALFGAQNPLCDDGSATGCAGANNVIFRVQNELITNGVRNQDGTVPTSTSQCLDYSTGNPHSSLLDCAEGDTYQVTVEYRYGLLTPILGAIVGDPVVLTSQSSATVLNLAVDPTPGLGVQKLVSTVGAVNAADIQTKCLEVGDIGGDGFYRSPCLDSSTSDPTDKLTVRFDSYDPITYRIRAINTGATTLTGVTLTDTPSGWPATTADCPARPVTLVSGAQYQCAYTVIAPATPGTDTEVSVANTVTGSAAGVLPVQDAVTVIVEKPALLYVIKRVSPYQEGDDGDGVPGFGSATQLDTFIRTAATFPTNQVRVWYRILVRNEGAKPATNVQIVDSAGTLPYGANSGSAICDSAPTTLNPGDTFVCRYVVTYSTPGTKDNVVTATSPDVSPDGNDSSDVEVEVNNTTCNQNNDRVVPDLVGLTLSAATTTWTAAGFTGTVNSGGMAASDTVRTQSEQAWDCQGRSTSITLTSVDTP